METGIDTIALAILGSKSDDFVQNVLGYLRDGMEKSSDDVISTTHIPDSANMQEIAKFALLNALFAPSSFSEFTK